VRYTEQFTWNALGQMLTGEALRNGARTSLLTYTYDGYNRLTNEQQELGPVGSATTYTIACTYDDDNNPDQLTYSGSALTLDHDYDKISRLTTIKEGMTNVLEVNYIGPSRIDTRVTSSSGTSQTQTYTWDGWKRAERIIVPLKNHLPRFAQSMAGRLGFL